MKPIDVQPEVIWCPNCRRDIKGETDSECEVCSGMGTIVVKRMTKTMIAYEVSFAFARLGLKALPYFVVLLLGYLLGSL